MQKNSMRLALKNNQNQYVIMLLRVTSKSFKDADIARFAFREHFWGLTMPEKRIIICWKLDTCSSMQV